MQVSKMLLLVGCIAFDTSGADNLTIPIDEAKLLPSTTSKFFEIYVSEAQAEYYADPDEATHPIWSLAWASELRVDARRLKTAKPGWLPVAPLGQVIKDNRSKWINIPAGWVRRRDVVLPSEFRNVKACWPIKHVTYTAGDYEVTIEFRPDGTGLAQDNSGKPTADVKMRTQVTMAKNIVDISAVGPYRRYFFAAGYLASERRLYPHGTLDDIQQVPFEEAELGGCKGLPTLTN